MGDSEAATLAAAALRLLLSCTTVVRACARAAPQLYKSVLVHEASNVEAIASLAAHHFYTDQPEIALRWPGWLGRGRAGGHGCDGSTGGTLMLVQLNARGV